MKNTFHQLIQAIRQRLMRVYQDNALCTQYAWWTLEAITQKSRTELMVMHELNLTREQSELLEVWVQAMVDRHKPIQYLMGSVPFMDLTIAIQPPILIPRPETEEWIATLLGQLQLLSCLPLNILDLCSGSGCIALALGKNLPHTTIMGVDIDTQALALARENAQNNKVANVTFVRSDLYNQLSLQDGYDLIVSNPPYISEQVWRTLDASVMCWEARHALVAPDNGLAIIKKIIDGAPKHIRPNQVLETAGVPNLMIEIGYDQGECVAQYMREKNIVEVRVHKDLAGRDRVVSGSVRTLESR